MSNRAVRGAYSTCVCHPGISIAAAESWLSSLRTGAPDTDTELTVGQVGAVEYALAHLASSATERAYLVHLLISLPRV